MSRRTKKVGSSGRYGARYGLSVKKQMKAVEKNKGAKYACPRCSKVNVKRVASGIWECRSCELKFTGGAYQPVTGKFKLIENRLGSV
ncbi:MAG: 50S ribosomal protein L37ae [Candidatus Thermoplasmatota archaeon]|jgi:large subunit ribosomal protein L37Ae|nr:50S ribosomal protein L37ae [Candidatus Thermoplasmatota archaeon]